MYASSSEFVTKDERMHELIQSEIQWDIISEIFCHFRHVRAEVFRFLSVKYTPPGWIIIIRSFRSRFRRVYYL